MANNQYAIRCTPCFPVPLISTSWLPDYLINVFLPVFYALSPSIRNPLYAIRCTLYEVRIITYEFISKNMQNKPNFLDALMNLISLITVDYENIANCKLCENKANTNPTCRGVASGEDGSEPIQSQKMLLRAFSSGSLSNKLRMDK